MDVMQIIKAHLNNRGCCGLMSPVGDCNCPMDDLLACGAGEGCREAYLGPCSDGDESRCVYPTREAADSAKVAAQEAAKAKKDFAEYQYKLAHDPLLSIPLRKEPT